VETRVRTPLGLRRSEHVSESRDCPWPRIGPAACTEPSPIRTPCPLANVLTVSGPSSSAARDAAIAEAVADASDQAQAAADAAGIHLGAVPDMHVSAMAVVYPIEGTVTPNSGIAVGSTGSSGAGSDPGATGAGATPIDTRIGDRHNHLGDQLAKPGRTPELVGPSSAPRMPPSVQRRSMTGLTRSSGPVPVSEGGATRR